jgi:hypothetical protein
MKTCIVCAIIALDQSREDSLVLAIMCGVAISHVGSPICPQHSATSKILIPMISKIVHEVTGMTIETTVGGVVS